ncbi:hypothetical protein FGO68_gene16301 [Halteria grandinella]|uniref:Uncharacterized protein n=1 Tax=Halteria grandinella TaxID=5974 RepID=A0A8J8NSL9_HALGN|nr:hypothetical protein FGO68_gene16301 [Halteria grandinella]
MIHPKKVVDYNFKSDQKRDNPDDLIEQAAAFIKNAEEILVLCDSAVFAIEKASATNKETAEKIKAYTKLIIQNMENKLQIIMNGQSKSSYNRQKEILTFIERNKDNMDHLRASIQTLQSQIKAVKFKLQIKNQAKVQSPKQLKGEGCMRHCHFQVKQNVVEQNCFVDAEFCGNYGDYIAIYQKGINETTVYDLTTMRNLINQQEKHRILCVTNQYLVLGSFLYFKDKQGQFQSIKRLDSGIASAVIIDSTYLIVGLPEYLRLETYAVAGISNFTKPLLRPFIMQTSGINKNTAVSQIERSILNSNTMLVSYKTKIVKASLDEIIGAKKLSRPSLTLDQIWFGQNSYIQCFKQIEEQYIIVLTLNQCLVIDQISTYVIHIVELSFKITSIFLCPNFNLAQKPWLVTLDQEGRVSMFNITQRTSQNGQGQGLIELLHQQDAQNGERFYYALNNYGQIEKLQILI